MKAVKKEKLVAVRFTAARYEEMLKKAEEKGITLSALVSLAVSEYLEKK